MIDHYLTMNQEELLINYVNNNNENSEPFTLKI